MAREIKFRAKRLDNNEFVIGYYLPMAEGYRHFIYLPLEYLNEHSRIEINPKTLGQYTGLLDKNGKEICKGDIVRVNDDRDGDRTYEVIFEKGCYWGNCIYTPRITTPQKTLLCDLDFFVYQSQEIIGNIYENPELIKGGKWLKKIQS